MEVTALRIKLLMIVMLMCHERDQKVYAVSLRIDPNTAQFFQYESLTFYCEGVSYCEVVHAPKRKVPTCNKTNRRTSTGSSCTITNVFPADSGKYWFEGGSGERSNSVNIFVTDGSVILEIPALPVMEGEAVTLTCRNKTTSSHTSAHFYHYGDLIGISSTGNIIIHNVSKSDEGLYKCSISGAGESAESRLIVRDGQTETVTSSFKDMSTTSSKERVASSSSSTPWIVVPVILLVLLVLVGLVYFFKGFSGKENKDRDNVEPASTSTTTYALVTKDRKMEVSESVESTSSSTTDYAVVRKNRKKQRSAVSGPSAGTNSS
uniref:Ig-like domain-containing protein n=1 Tax=Anabas testudineus TaxID=64144 RepID=A0AAQ6IRX8_ANATE